MSEILMGQTDTFVHLSLAARPERGYLPSSASTGGHRLQESGHLFRLGVSVSPLPTGSPWKPPPCRWAPLWQEGLVGGMPLLFLAGRGSTSARGGGHWLTPSDLCLPSHSFKTQGLPKPSLPPSFPLNVKPVRFQPASWPPSL